MDPRLASGVTGAAPIWNRVMHTLLDNQPVAHFEKPANIASVKVDGRNDLAISGNIPKALVNVKSEQTPGTTDKKTVFSDSFSSYATPSTTASLKDEKTN